MEDKTLDITYEKELIDMLGYNIVGPDTNNRWIILEDDNQIGFIQYKKLHSRKKNKPAVYGYHTEIDSSTIIYNESRSSMMDRKNYNIYVKTENEIPDYYTITLGNAPSIKASGKKCGPMSFSIAPGFIELEFQSKNDQYVFEEFVSYDNIKQSFSYTVTSIDNESNEQSSLVLSARSDNFKQSNKLLLTQYTWKNEILEDNYSSIVEGTIDDLVSNLDMINNSFDYFKSLINYLLPFKENIYDTLVNDEVIINNNIESFFKAINKNNLKVNKKYKKIICKDEKDVLKD